MKKLLICSLILVALVVLTALPAQAATYSTINGSFTNSYGRNSVTVYYPIAQKGQVCPVVVFNGGDLTSKSWYSWIGKSLTPYGIIVAVVQIPNILDTMNYQKSASAIEGTITWLQNSSSIKNMVGDDIGVAGHSTGAEGALLAAEQDGRIDAVVSISPDKDSRVIMSNLSAINVPVLIISGSSDLIVNWRNSYDIYTQLSSTKEFICIRGAGHLDFLDGIFSSASKLSVAKKYTANWFRYFLQDDTSVESALFGSAAQADLTNRVLSVLEYTF